jgi:hypothetical protein
LGSALAFQIFCAKSRVAPHELGMIG